MFLRASGAASDDEIMTMFLFEDWRDSAVPGCMIRDRADRGQG